MIKEITLILVLFGWRRTACNILRGLYISIKSQHIHFFHQMVIKICHNRLQSNEMCSSNIT
jgi:hypothetical protein